MPISRDIFINSSIETTSDGSVYSMERYKTALVIWKYLAPVVLVIGTIGSMVSLLVLCQRSMRRQTTMFYLGVLGVADMMVLYAGLLRLWMEKAFDFYIRLESDWACKFHTFSVYVSLDFSVWILVAVSVDRLIFISLPYSARQWCTLKKARLVVAMTALVMAFINVHFLWTYRKELDSSISIAGNEKYRCYANSESKVSQRFIKSVWPWLDFCVYCMTPFIIMLGTNVIIARHLLKSDTKMAAHRHQALSRNQTIDSGRGASSVGDIEHSTSVGDSQHGTTIGDIQHGTSVGDIQHGTSIGDIQHRTSVDHLTSVGDIQHGTSVGDSQNGTSVGNIQHGTSVGDFQYGTGVGDIQHGTSVGDIRHRTSIGDIQHRTSVGDNQHGTSVGNIQHGTSVSNIQHGTSVGDIQHVTRVGNIQHGTSVGNIQHGTCVGDIQHVTSVGNIQHGTRVGNIQHGTSVGDIQQVTSVGNIQHGTSVGDAGGAGNRHNSGDGDRHNCVKKTKDNVINRDIQVQKPVQRGKGVSSIVGLNCQFGFCSNDHDCRKLQLQTADVSYTKHETDQHSPHAMKKVNQGNKASLFQEEDESRYSSNKNNETNQNKPTALTSYSNKSASLNHDSSEGWKERRAFKIDKVKSSGILRLKQKEKVDLDRSQRQKQSFSNDSENCHHPYTNRQTTEEGGASALDNNASELESVCTSNNSRSTGMMSSRHVRNVKQHPRLKPKHAAFTNKVYPGNQENVLFNDAIIVSPSETNAIKEDAHSLPESSIGVQVPLFARDKERAAQRKTCGSQCLQNVLMAKTHAEEQSTGMFSMYKIETVDIRGSKSDIFTNCHNIMSAINEIKTYRTCRSFASEIDVPQDVEEPSSVNCSSYPSHTTIHCDMVSKTCAVIAISNNSTTCVGEMERAVPDIQCGGFNSSMSNHFNETLDITTDISEKRQNAPNVKVSHCELYPPNGIEPKTSPSACQQNTSPPACQQNTSSPKADQKDNCCSPKNRGEKIESSEVYHRRAKTLAALKDGPKHVNTDSKTRTRSRLAPVQNRTKTTSISVTLLAINVLFWLLNAPIMVYIIGFTYWIIDADDQRLATLELAWAVVNILQYSNNAVHVFLYCLTGPRFRKELLRLIRRARC